MRHYEIVFLVHPDRSKQVPKIIQQYKSIVESANGKVHRLEDWGLRKLSYPINKSGEAHYVLMNIECTHETRKEITDNFRFNDAVLRNLTLNRERPVIERSPVMQSMEKKAKEEKKAEEEKKAAKLQRSKEQNVPPDTDTSTLPPAKSDKQSAEKTKKEILDANKETAKATGDAIKANKSDAEESPKTNEIIGENNAEDTSEKTQHTDSSKE